jgi:hypothetical protein
MSAGAEVAATAFLARRGARFTVLFEVMDAF